MSGHRHGRAAVWLLLAVALPAVADLKFFSGNITNLGGNAPLLFDTDWDGSFDIAMTGNGRLGVGTLAPAGNLHVAGNVVIRDGLQAANRVLVSDASGLGAWTDPAALPGGWTEASGNAYRTAGRIGLGTSSPSANLHVAGTFQLVDGNQAVNRVLASDASGLAAWTDLSTLTGSWTLLGGNVYRATGNVGVGTAAPAQTLQVAGNILVGDGSPTTPGLAFGSDPDTGICLRSTGNLMLVTAGGNRMLVDHRGYVGIGTVQPNENLHVVSGNIFVYTGRMAIATGYSGTDGQAMTSAPAASVATLHLHNPTSSSGTLGGSLLVSNHFAGYGNIRSSSVSHGSNSNGMHMMLLGVSTGDQASTWANTRFAISQLVSSSSVYVMTAMSTGAFGFFNATTPTAAIDTTLYRDAANCLALRGASGNIMTFRVYNAYTDANNHERATLGWSSNVLVLGAERAGTGQFRPLSLSGNGVGIGTTAPSANLHIAGNLLLADGSQGAGKVLASNASGLGTWTDVNTLVSSAWTLSGGNVFLTNGGNIMPLTASAENIGSSANPFASVYAVHFNVLSDRRLKTNVRELPYGLKEVLDLEPVAFEWTRGGDTTLGLLAQDVRKVVKEAVSVGDDAQRTMGIRYNELVPVLIKAIQEQQAVIGRERERGARQEREIAAIRDELRALRARLEPAGHLE